MKTTIILMVLCVVLGTFFNFLTIKRYIRKKKESTKYIAEEE
jgi:preprotein translocase subunit YajC